MRVTYHFEDGAWWADSSDVPSYYAGATTLARCRELAEEGLAFHRSSEAAGRGGQP